MSDNESLAYVFRGNYLCYSAYETRHIAFMWDVATDLRYIRGIENVATNALSRVEVVFPSLLVTDASLAEDEGLQQ